LLVYVSSQALRLDVSSPHNHHLLPHYLNLRYGAKQEEACAALLGGARRTSALPTSSLYIDILVFLFPTISAEHPHQTVNFRKFLFAYCDQAAIMQINYENNQQNR
jgi:hypothetical protein